MNKTFKNFCIGALGMMAVGGCFGQKAFAQEEGLAVNDKTMEAFGKCATAVAKERGAIYAGTITGMGDEFVRMYTGYQNLIKYFDLGLGGGVKTTHTVSSQGAEVEMTQKMTPADRSTLAKLQDCRVKAITTFSK